MDQVIARPHGVTVFGSGLTRTEPDRALIELEVRRTELEPGNALDATRESVKAVREALTRSMIDTRQIETSRVGVYEDWEHHPVKKMLGYAASVTLRVRVHDVELVEPVLIAVVAAGASRIFSVVYETSRLPELRRETRSAAIFAARAKAELYCEAAGCRAGAVTHIEDLDPSRFPVATSRDSYERPRASDAEDDGSFGSGSLTVVAAVMVSYALLSER
jgi:uncharacterized protein YggE